MDIDLMLAELRQDEGVRYVPYLDSRGIPSCGVGHNLRVHPLPAGWAFPLNDIQVDQLLTGDLSDTFSQLDHFVPWWRTLDEVRQRVVANMAFNVGIAGFLEFRQAISAMSAGNYLAASVDMKNSVWYTQVGVRAARLCQAMQTGVMPQ